MSAWTLHRKGWAVTVLEQGAIVGGAVRTISREGYQVECGPNTMMVASAEFEAALWALGLGAVSVKPSTRFKKRFLVRHGVLNAAPASLGEFIRTPLFSTEAKLRLLGDLLWGARVRKDLDDESVGSYFRRHFGAEVVDYVVKPVITGVYAGDADRLSLRYAFPFVWEAALRSRSVLRGLLLNLRDKRKRGQSFKPYMLSFKGGLATLPATLAAQLPQAPVTRATVTAISYTGIAGQGVEASAVAAAASALPGSWRISYRTPDSTAQTVLEADALVLAAPAGAVARLPLPESLSRHLGVLNEIEYPPLANVALGYSREQVAHALDGFGAMVPAKEKAEVLGVLFSSSVFPGVAPEGKVLLTTFIGGTRAPQLAQLPESELVAHAHAQLKELLGISGEPEFSQVTLWPRAIPQVTLGYQRFFDALDEAERTHPGLSIVGNYRGQVALGKCAEAAAQRAEALHELFAAASSSL